MGGQESGASERPRLGPSAGGNPGTKHERQLRDQRHVRRVWGQSIVKGEVCTVMERSMQKLGCGECRAAVALRPRRR